MVASTNDGRYRTAIATMTSMNKEFVTEITRVDLKRGRRDGGRLLLTHDFGSFFTRLLHLLQTCSQVHHVGMNFRWNPVLVLLLQLEIENLTCRITRSWISIDDQR